VSAHDVERELRHHLPDIGEAKLHKLLYYCQGYACTWLGEPMFREEIEAWGMGPVVADVWRDKKYELGLPAPTTLSAEARDIVAFVAGTYGRLTGQRLIAQTHQEAPWKDVYTRMVNHEIKVDALEKFFSTVGPRARTLRWLSHYRADPVSAETLALPEAPEKPYEADSLAELRQRRAAAARG
jgi:uncharacterized phage-associated protein